MLSYWPELIGYFRVDPIPVDPFTKTTKSASAERLFCRATTNFHQLKQEPFYPNQTARNVGRRSFHMEGTSREL